MRISIFCLDVTVLDESILPLYLQSPDAKTIILSCQTVCANISDISDSQMNVLSN